MVSDLEPARFEQRLDLAIDQLLELRTRVEIGDCAAVGAHQVMVMVLRQFFGEFVSIAASDANNSDDNTCRNQLGENSIHSRGRHARPSDDFLDRQRPR